MANSNRLFAWILRTPYWPWPVGGLVVGVLIVVVYHVAT
jgi:hypothetical protein